MNPNTVKFILLIFVSVDLTSGSRLPLFSDQGEGEIDTVPYEQDLPDPGQEKKFRGLSTGGRKLPRNGTELDPLTNLDPGTLDSLDPEEILHDSKMLEDLLKSNDHDAAASSQKDAMSTPGPSRKMPKFSPLKLFGALGGPFSRAEDHHETSSTSPATTDSARSLNSDFSFPPQSRSPSTDTDDAPARSRSTGSENERPPLPRQRNLSRASVNRPGSLISRLKSFSLLAGGSQFSENPTLSRIPPIRREALFGDPARMDYDSIVARALYADPTDQFTLVGDPSYDLIAKFLPLSRSRLSENLYRDRIAHDLESGPFAQHVEKAQAYLTSKFPQSLREQIEGLERMASNPAEMTIQDAELLELRDPGVIKDLARSNVMCSIGKGSTLDLNNIHKLAEANQRVIFTPRDIFYYPGMLKVSLFFNLEFDPSRSNEFFDQFIRTFYAGVFGPCRQDLFYITRIQDIPASVLPDELLMKSLKEESEEYAALNSQIRDYQNSFLRPENRDMLRVAYADHLLCYKKLTSVPKTTEDVLEATQRILKSYWSHMGITGVDVSDLIYSPQNIGHLQSFFMDILSIEDVTLLFNALVIDFDYDPGLRNHSASFLYAAFIETIRTPRGSDIKFVALIQKKMKEMFELRTRPAVLDSIHKESVRVSETDIAKQSR